MSELALQAALCYNIDRNIVAQAVLVAPLSRTNPLRRFVMNTIPPTSGIYKITCTANNKIYIGSAVNLRNRKSQHIYTFQHNKHKNPIMQNAWNKYGEQAFIFEVLELVLVPDLLLVQEQYWLDKLKPFGRKGFNIYREAGSGFGHEVSPEARAKISQARLGKKRSPEAAKKSADGHRGIKRSPEFCERVRQTSTGNKNFLDKKHTPETRERMRQSALAIWQERKGSNEHG